MSHDGNFDRLDVDRGFCVGWARGKRQVSKPGMRHVQHQMTDSCQAHKDEMQSV